MIPCRIVFAMQGDRLSLTFKWLPRSKQKKHKKHFLKALGVDKSIKSVLKTPVNLSPLQRTPLPISFPYSYTSRDSYGSGLGVYSMGMGIPLLGVPEISLELNF